MITVVVASKNPEKVRVAQAAFRAVLPKENFLIVSVDAPSGVPDQPFEGDTLRGAENRLLAIQHSHPNADYWMSQEGGLFEEGGGLWNKAWILVADRRGFVGKAATASFMLPTEVARNVRRGMESGPAYDKFFRSSNCKASGGGIRFLTDNVLDRKAIYEQAAIIALAQVKHQQWYRN